MDYLNLLKQLFKNLVTHHKYNALSQDFVSMCMKMNTNRVNGVDSSEMYIIENLVALFNTNIKELKDIITELMMNLPIRSRHVCHILKINSSVIKIFLHGLTFSDQQFLSKNIHNIFFSIKFIKKLIKLMLNR